MTFRSGDTAPPPLVGAEVALEMLRRKMKFLTSNIELYSHHTYTDTLLEEPKEMLTCFKIFGIMLQPCTPYHDSMMIVYITVPKLFCQNRAVYRVTSN